MLPYEVIYNRLIKNEGIRFKPYICPAGYLTIGVGRNLQLNPLTEEEKETIKDVNQGITKDQAFMLLRHDVDSVMRDLDKNIPFWRELNNDRQYVMIDLCFQLGIVGLLKFRRMLLSIASGNYDDAAEHCLDSKYARQTPKRAQRNANALKTGVYNFSVD